VRYRANVCGWVIEDERQAVRHDKERYLARPRQHDGIAPRLAERDVLRPVCPGSMNLSANQ
jgi:hypothetical protein